MKKGTIYKETMKTGSEEKKTKLHGLGKDFEQQETEETEKKFNREPREMREPFSKVTTSGHG